MRRSAGDLGTMVLESTMICIDNSEWTRNGDYLPTRVQAQRKAATTVFYYKRNNNPENTVGLVAMAGKRGAPNLLCTLTTDESKMTHCIDEIEPRGEVNLLTGIQVAQLALKHRANTNLHQRILVFVSSPVPHDREMIEKTGARLKKESISIDIVYMGEDPADEELLMALYNKANNANNSSHFLRVPPGTDVMRAVSSSPILVEESAGGGGFAAEASAGNAQAAAALRASELGTEEELGFDPATDPALAMAIMASRQEEQQRLAAVAAQNAATESAASKGDGGVGDSTPQAAPEVSGEAAATAAAAAAADGDMMDEEAELMQQAMAMSRGYDPAFYAGNAGMDEDEALARAMAMSMEGTQPAAEAEGGEPDPTDPEYMASVLANLPGVNPDDPALKDALDNLKKGGGDS